MTIVLESRGQGDPVLDRYLVTVDVCSLSYLSKATQL